MKKKELLLWCCVFTGSLTYAQQRIVENKTKKPRLVQVWLSTADQTKNLSREADVKLGSDRAKDSGLIIQINNDVTYQKWIGCGSCTNDGSSWLMFKKLKTAVKDDLVKKLFDKKDGIGMDWVRQQMGSGDAAVINGGWWTYDDLPKGQTDPELSKFSIDMEKDYILPMLKQAIRINPSLKIIGCPWTPPGWMKTSAEDTNPLTHGNIQPRFYSAFANYFVKFIQAYQKEGIPMYGISLQNEPLASKQKWQACGISADVTKDLIKNYFTPAFKAQQIGTRIYIFDHNWKDGINFISNVYKDSAARNEISGSMWHHYEGLPSAMSESHRLYPEQEIWFSEGCATNRPINPIYQDFNTYRGSFLNFSYNMINVPRNWCQTMMMYQIAMDPDYGPAVFDHPTNYGMVTIDPRKGTILYRPEYYTLGHVSKFVYPDAYRIDTNQYEGEVESVGFRNPDGSIVLVLSNRTAESKVVKIKLAGRAFSYKLPKESMASFIM